MQYRTEWEKTMTKQFEPWYYETETERVFAPVRRTVCWMKPSHQADPQRVIEEGRLIAAAQEMYEALKACQLQLLQSGDHHEYTEQALNLAEAAIRKAEGK